MWFKQYKDYPIDKPLRQERVQTGKGIVGCEMNDAMGWGQSHHHTKPKPPGLLAMFFMALFGSKRGDA